VSFYSDDVTHERKSQQAHILQDYGKIMQDLGAWKPVSRSMARAWRELGLQDNLG
jgi:hypothetical protein